MVSRKGSLLEKNVEKLLKLSGFNPELNKIIKDYEIDIFLLYKGQKIAFECKQYERSSLVVRNLIHQWDSKNKELGFDRIILVLVGIEVQDKDYELARKYGVIIWDEDKLTKLSDLAIENKTENKDKVLRELNIKSKNEIKKIKIDFRDIEQNKDTEQYHKIIEYLELNHNIKSFLIRGIDVNNDIIREINIGHNHNGVILCLKFSMSDKSNLDLIQESLKTLKFKPKKLESNEYKRADGILSTLKGGVFLARNQIINNLQAKEYIYFNCITEGEVIIYAQFGDDIKSLAYLCDFIFRKIAGFGLNYEVGCREL